MKPETITCDCGHTIAKPDPAKFCGVGYGVDNAGKTSCYECCGKQDLAQMEKDGKTWLYLTRDATGGKLTNRPGTLVFFPSRIKKSGHNMAGSRYDVWFTDKQGRAWHGVNYGENTQICHCKRMKAKK